MLASLLCALLPRLVCVQSPTLAIAALPCVPLPSSLTSPSLTLSSDRPCASHQSPSVLQCHRTLPCAIVLLPARLLPDPVCTLPSQSQSTRPSTSPRILDPSSISTPAHSSKDVCTHSELSDLCHHSLPSSFTLLDLDSGPLPSYPSPSKTLNTSSSPAPQPTAPPSDFFRPPAARSRHTRIPPIAAATVTLSSLNTSHLLAPARV